MIKYLFMILTILCIFSVSYCADFKEVSFVRNYDGDTIVVNIKDVHPLLGEEIAVRIAGIDTPEIKAGCEEEKKKALIAKEFVKKVCGASKRIELRDAGRDKYFRILASVYVDGLNLGDIMIREGMAVPYDGGTKPNWCTTKY